MFDKSIFITDAELKEFGQTDSLSLKVESLLSHQIKNWKLAQENFESLDHVLTKNFLYENETQINIQFNPERIKSTSAKVDKDSIKNRKCFLCMENLPSPQKGIRYKNNYQILVNPYPIFKQHLTIPHLEHIPQEIHNSFKDLLELSYDLKDQFFVFYNGPKCGASAPDHLHFQAGLKNSTPLEMLNEKLFSESNIKIVNDGTSVAMIDTLVFKYFQIKSNTILDIETWFLKILELLKTQNMNAEEPLLNLICSYNKSQWNLFIVPRRVHRPSHYYLEGDEQYLISPASVDVMGLLITPVESNFIDLDKDVVQEIYSQVLFTSANMNEVWEKLFENNY